MATSSSTLAGTAQGEGVLPALLSTLPEGTPHIKFTSMQEIQELVRIQNAKSFETRHFKSNFSSPFVAVTNIPSTILQDLDQIYPDRGPRVTADFKSRILILETMLLQPHETFTGYLTNAVNKRLERMGLIYSIIPSLATTVNYGNFSKQPDASWKPKFADGPTLVLETGLSEREDKLAIDAHAWLEAHGSKTNMVITAKINRGEPLIILERWEKDTAERKGPITRSHRDMMNASMTLEVRISHRNARTRATGDLEIPFEAVAGRPPSSTGDHDMIITRRELEQSAEVVWQLQGFM